MQFEVNLRELGISSVLITNHHLRIYAGSELVTFDLATAFKQAGAQVTVATFDAGPPLMEHFEQAAVPVVNPLHDPLLLAGQRFDLAWAQHWPVLGFCRYELGTSFRYLILASLSAYAPLECFPLSTRAADAIVFNSQENLELQLPSLEQGSGGRAGLFPNSLTQDWLEPPTRTERPASPALIGIISNHPPLNIRSVVEQLRSAGVQVRVLGTEDEKELVTPGMLDEMDAVITIGHSVQKAMARAVPVFCYDYFGGPGWLNPANVERAAHYNYSGRCCYRRLSRRKLMAELCGGYAAALTHAETLRRRCVETYNLETQLVAVLKRLPPHKDWPPAPDDNAAESTGRKLCQLYVKAAFGAALGFTANLRAEQPELIRLIAQLEPEQVWSEHLVEFSVNDPPCDKWWFGAQQRCRIGGIVAARDGDDEVLALTISDGADITVNARLGLSSPQFGRRHPELSTGAVSRYRVILTEIPTGRPLMMRVHFASGKQLVVGRLWFESSRLDR